MDTIIDTTVTVAEGDLSMRAGKALTSFYFKGQERFVFRTSELNILAEMIRVIQLNLSKPKE